MRRHAGAVILLGGWLLMEPPFNPHDPLGINLDAPISKWDQAFAFDTARECEETHLRLEQEGEGDTTRRHEGGPPVAVRRRRMTMARCVPAESVYPPQPTAPK